MNKRPLMPGGLPAKPNYIGPVAPAPPLPSGPPPQQPQQVAYQDPAAAAAHAAAWNAYFLAQGYSTGQGQPQVAGVAPSTPNAGASTPDPYANYGYGGAVQQQHAYQTPAGPSQPYRPPVQQQAHSQQPQPQRPPQQQPQPQPQPQPQYQQQYAQQGYAGPPQGQAGFQSPAGYQTPQHQPQYHQQPPPQHQQQQQAQYGWGGPAQQGPQQPMQPQQPRPPQQYNQQQNYYSQQPQQHQQPQQPYAPQSQPNQFRPPARPNAASIPNRPYQPQANRLPSGPARPPLNVAQPNNFPPAKRPRFDAPIPGSGQPRPPVRPTGPALHASIPARPPSGPSARLPQPPIARPPIHLGTGGPPVGFAPSGPRAVPVPLRGSIPTRGRGGMLGAPRGPAGSRNRDKDGYSSRSKRGDTPGRDRRDKRRETERELKTTMTDFRIVGIEMKELGWKWGLVGEAANIKDEEVKVEDANGDHNSDEMIVDTIAIDESSKSEDKVESKTEDNEVETSEEKVGGKRKAQSPDGDDEGSSKKRSSNYLMTHGKINDPLTASHESNQNRFRIYFDSPPELDRIPKALRRNPNKRWRRESTVLSHAGEEVEKVDTASVAKLGEVVEAEEVPQSEVQDGDVENTEHPDAEKGITAEVTARAHDSSIAAEGVALPADLVPVDAEIGDADISMMSDAGEIAFSSLEEVATEALINGVTGQSAGGSSVADNEPQAGTVSITTNAANEPNSDVQATAASDANVVAQSPASTKAETKPASSVPQSPVHIPKGPSSIPTKPRGRRRSSVSSTWSHDSANEDEKFKPEVTPSTNRLSILYEGSSRRLCFDAEVVEKLKIFREEGKIVVTFVPSALTADVESENAAGGNTTEEKIDEGKNDSVTGSKAEETKFVGLPKGFLLETYDNNDQRFMPLSKARLEELYKGEGTDPLPPLHKAVTVANQALTLTVYLNKKKPLSEPKWCRTNLADDWLVEQFGSKTVSGWKGKLEIADPDPAPTLASILEGWTGSTTSGSSSSRAEFTKSLLSDPNDLLEILLRLTRGDRNPTYSSSSASFNPNASPLATAIRSDSPYASHQTHVSLAILAMYRLTTDYAAKAGESSEVVNEKIADIIKSLPSGMIYRSLDGMFREWETEKREEKRKEEIRVKKEEEKVKKEKKEEEAIAKTAEKESGETKKIVEQEQKEEVKEE